MNLSRVIGDRPRFFTPTNNRGQAAVYAFGDASKRIQASRLRIYCDIGDMQNHLDPEPTWHPKTMTSLPF